MKKTHKVHDLEQVRLLADPLKLPLLQAFAEGPKTTKQVAAELGQSITRLYRHVDALYDAGLLEIVSEQQKRGTVERTFRAIAARFEVEQSLFSDAGSDTATGAVRDMLQGAEQEIIDVLSDPDIDCEKDAVILRMRIRASRPRLQELRELLEQWVEQASDEAGEDQEADAEAGALIAFYPLRSHKN